MDRAHTTGMIIMAGSVLGFLLFAYGALRRSYTAVALPVAAAMSALTALAFWVGWTMMTMEEEPEEAAITAVDQPAS
jgi:hypothetical protein